MKKWAHKCTSSHSTRTSLVVTSRIHVGNQPRTFISCFTGISTQHISPNIKALNVTKDTYLSPSKKANLESWLKPNNIWIEIKILAPNDNIIFPLEKYPVLFQDKRSHFNRSKDTEYISNQQKTAMEIKPWEGHLQSSAQCTPANPREIYLLIFARPTSLPSSSLRRLLLGGAGLIGPTNWTDPERFFWVSFVPFGFDRGEKNELP